MKHYYLKYTGVIKSFQLYQTNLGFGKQNLLAHGINRKYVSFFFKNSSTFGILIIVFLFSSCEKVIDIDLNAKVPQIVIEGNITDQAEPCKVKITKTVNYDESNDFPDVSGASVSISDNFGHSELLSEISAGVYSTSSMKGIPGRTYTLKVSTNGNNYTATSTMHAPVYFDKLTIISQNLPMGNKKVVYVEFIDPSGIVNYYSFIKIINNTIQSPVFTEDDLTQDGKAMKIGLFNKEQEEVKLKTGDTVTVMLQVIDENIYNYFRTLLQLSSGGLIHQSSTPANPLSNFDNGALGYFNASSITSKTIVVP